MYGERNRLPFHRENEHSGEVISFYRFAMKEKRSPDGDVCFCPGYILWRHPKIGPLQSIERLVDELIVQESSRVVVFRGFV